MSKDEHIRKIIIYHKREAEEEYKRRVGGDPVYDQITWSNIEPFLPRQGRVLDAGGGAGVWSIEIAEHRKKCLVALLDVTLELLKTAKRKIKDRMLTERIEVLDADIRDIPLVDTSFDFVLCEADPLCICGDPDRAVSELSRVLKPNRYLVAGVDSTLYRVFKAFSQGKSLDNILDFMQTELSPAEEEAPFDSKSFTPNELVALLGKHGLETVRIVGKPIGFGPHMLDGFVAALPAKRRKSIFENTKEQKKLTKILHRIYDEPYIAGIGSHLHIVTMKKIRSNRTV